MDLLRKRGLQVASILVLIIALGATAYPTDWAKNLEAAGIAIQSGKPDLALPALADAIALEPQVGELRELAEIGALASYAAYQEFEYLDLFSEGDVRIKCLEMRDMLLAGRVKEALARVAEVPCQDEAAPIYEEANRLAAEGEFQEAASILQVLLTALPSTAEASESLGVLTAVSDPEGALAHLRLAIDLDPGAALLADELTQVIEAARIEVNEAYTLAQVGQALARAEQWNLAAAAFANALQIDPQYTEARAYYGLALDRAGQDGLAEIERAAAEAPNAPLPHALLGKHWLTRGHPEQAVAAYERAAELDSQDPLIAIDLGAAYAAAGDLQAARMAYEYATDLDPDDADLWNLLAQFSLDYEIELAKLGLPAARRAVRLQPRDAAALDRLGYTHFLLGDEVLSERFILESIRIDRSLASAQYHLGLLMLAGGDVAAAGEAFSSAAALNPDGRYGILALRSLENLNQ